MTPRSGLVGRRAESAAIDETLDRLDAETRGPVVQVVGEPGIGKSRLLSELCSRAEERSHLVLAGRAAEFELDLPFGVLVDALDDYLCSLGPTAVTALGETVVADLATTFPALASSVRAERPVLRDERFRNYRAIRLLLDHLARSRRLVLALDDLHWADPASQELVAHLLAHPPGARVALALAFRPAQLPSRLASALAASERDGTSMRLELAPISRDELDELVGGCLEPATGDRLYSQSGGNPFYIEQLARQSTPSPSGEAWAAEALVPPAVASALSGELAALPPEALLVLEAAAVAGDPFDTELATAIADQTDAAAWTAFDLLLERNLVGATDVPQRLRFRHPIVRRAVYAGAKASWRRDAHRRAVGALRSRGADPVAVAHHVERSASWGDEQAVELLTAAAEATSARAPATAARWYESAVRLVPSDPSWAPRRSELSMALAEALVGAGRLDDGRRVLDGLLDEPGISGSTHAGLLAWAAALESHLGRAGDARARLGRAVARLGDQNSEEALKLTLVLADTSATLRDYGEARHFSSRALEGARLLGAGPLATAAAAKLAWADHFEGRIGDAKRHCDEAAGVLDELADDALADFLDAAFSVALAEAYLLGRFDDAIRHARRGERLCRSTGRGQLLLPLQLARAWAMVERGALGQAVALAQEVVDANRATGNGYGLMVSFWVLSVAMFHTGDAPSAEAAGGQAWELAQSFDAGDLAPACAIAFGRALVGTGRADRAREEVLAACGGRALPHMSRFQRCAAYDVLTAAALARGDIVEADTWADQALALLDDEHLLIEAAAARRTKATVLLARGDAAQAAGLALDAAVQAEKAGARIEEALGRILGGRSLAQSGDRDRAVIELERAETEMGLCGAIGYRDEIRAELDRLRRHQPRRARVGHVGLRGLTDREREIAALVCEGKTNREIAAQCFLSVKTVERHVAHLFDKLGVKSRSAVAALVARER